MLAHKREKYSVLLFSAQKDDLDGEIDLKSCVKVSEFDVEKNYGFQIQVTIYVKGQTLSKTVYVAVFHPCICTFAFFLILLLTLQLQFFILHFFSCLLHHLHLTPVLPHPLLFLTSFFSLVFSDAGGRVHTVCHDSWNQAELDRGFKEVYSAQQLSRPHTVITTRLLEYFKASLMMK